MVSLPRLAGTAFLVLTLAGCGPGQPTAPPTGALPPPAAEDAGSRDFGDYVIHYNALRTSDLTPEVARAYNIVRSPNRAMLNVSMIRKAEGTAGTPVPGSVSAQAVNLNGQLKNLVLREIREGDAVYYIGDVDISSDETLVFTIDATPINETSRFSVRFSQPFVGSR